MTDHIAYLILAHAQPAQLARLVRRIADPRARILIHIDGKAAREPFEAALSGTSATILPPGRTVAVAWGDTSMVRATLNLLAEALADPSIQRFSLLSGADYPTRPAAALAAELLQLPTVIEVTGTADRSRRKGYNHNVNRYWFAGHRLLGRNSPYPRLSGTLNDIIGVMPRLSWPRVPLYKGSAWWLLDREMAEYIMSYHAAHPELLRWLDRSLAPDELFFHTVAMTDARFAAGAAAIAHTATGRCGVHYIDWSESRASPKALSLADLPAIEASGALFVRKTDPAISAELLDALDRRGASA